MNFDFRMKRLNYQLLSPMYNEEKNIDHFFAKLLPVLESLDLSYEVICINDGSTDETIQKVLEFHKINPRIKLINLSRNFGKDNALTAGLNYASGRAVVPIDSDLQDPPELIEVALSKMA